MLQLLTPHLHVAGVCELTPERLRAMGLRSLLLDVDCTLKRYRQSDVPPEVAAWIEQLRIAGIGLCLVSNGGARRISRLAERYDLPYVARALKPLPLGCWAAVRKMHFEPSRTAMVGDQVFADVLAARLAGLRSILVDPIHPEEEPWFTRLKRPPERRWLAWRLAK